ncbi:MAG TPA: DUF202 domain-containing protein [Noviherbaspirillum sp.]
MPVHNAPSSYDPGLQAERTALAWSRTAFAFLVNALLWLRAGLADDDSMLLLFGLALLALAAGFHICGRRRGRALMTGARPVPVHPALMRALALGAALACLLAAAASAFAGKV